jgi:RNA polymerase sigma factor (sigma-70 family)
MGQTRGDGVASGWSGYASEFPALEASARTAAVRVLGPGDDADEVVQEAVTRAYFEWSAIPDGDDASEWIARVSRALALDTRRQARRREPMIDLSDDPQDAALERIEVRQALAALAPRQRAAVELRYLEDQTLVDTAETMGCSLSSVRQSSKRGLKHLKTRFLAAGLAVFLLLAAAAIAMVHIAPHNGPRSVVVVGAADRGFNVRVSVAGDRVQPGGSLTATITVENVTDHDVTLWGARPACAFAPAVDLVAPSTTSANVCPPNAGAADVLAARAARSWTVPVAAVDSTGAPLDPGVYTVDALGVAPDIVVLPDTVTVVATPVAHAATVVAAPAGVDLVSANPAPMATNPSSSPDPTIAPRTPPPSTPPVTWPVTHPVRTPPVIPPPPLVPPNPPNPPASVPLALKVRSAQSDVSGSNPFGWRIEARNTTDRDVNATIVADEITVVTPDGLVHSRIHEEMTTPLIMRVRGSKTYTATVRDRFGSVPYIDGGYAGAAPATGTYDLTYVFDYADGTQSPPVRFVLTIH